MCKRYTNKFIYLLKKFLNLQTISEYPFIYQDDDYIYLYKHQPITDSRLKLLTEGTISFTKPDKFNDPFDSVGNIHENHHFSGKEFKEILKRKGIKMSLKKAEKRAKKYKENELKKINDLSFFAKMNSNIGVCCLNHNPLNILMWSHYADSHKGFLTEFKFKKQDLRKMTNQYRYFLPIPVTYLDEIPVISLDDRMNNGGTNVFEAYTTKSVEWSYEKEFRVIRPHTSESIQKLPYDDLICTVIGGVKISVNDEKKLRKICESSNIPYFRAERIPNTFRLTVPNHHQLDILTKSS